jgi:hypothetical protein
MYVACYSFGLTPASPLQVQTPLPAGQSCETSLTLATTGPVQRMEPLNTLQVGGYNLEVFFTF